MGEGRAPGRTAREATVVLTVRRDRVFLAGDAMSRRRPLRCGRASHAPTRGCGEPNGADVRPDWGSGADRGHQWRLRRSWTHRHLRLGTLLSVVRPHRAKTPPEPGGDDGAPGERPVVPALARLGDRLRANSRAVLLVTGLVLTAALLVGFGATRHHRTESAPLPETSQRPGAATPEHSAPRTYPTLGELVPPAPAAPKATPTPTPSATRTTPGPQRSPSERRCPLDWRQFPPFRDWCERNGYRTD
jgi:hypothetical protein